ncbi:6-phosphogluconolactonase [Rhodovulum imhoffii]|uniref:6-phosphogluconolactonase n=1 Tax=Rhodovulum imhoffii TaxID=365340 RepID=A0A2T5BTF6_9RHOB|nr:6-phosphogluconolactonase [Rhodovulum imhoffii]MBK5934333.1 6-phosphogluconolactonase [Rhodovulum imhoffii]PTN02716.1 6-phosphogluconolactonase [Rhodovulum imhoffii]
MKLIEYADSEMLTINLANIVAGELTTALSHGHWASLAVPGGQTPGPFFDDLCGVTLDWDRVRILPTDERLVPPGDPRSNEGLVRRRLLTGHAEKACFIGLRPGADGMMGVNDRVARYLPLSVLVLGMGEDGHVASLFPGADDLEFALAPEAPPVVETRPPRPGPARVSLSGPVLRGALSTHVLILGQNKREALVRADLLSDPLQAPVLAVLKDATVHWARA